MAVTWHGDHRRISRVIEVCCNWRMFNESKGAQAPATAQEGREGVAGLTSSGPITFLGVCQNFLLTIGKQDTWNHLHDYPDMAAPLGSPGGPSRADIVAGRPLVRASIPQRASKNPIEPDAICPALITWTLPILLSASLSYRSNESCSV